MAALVLRLRDRELSRVPIRSTRMTIGRDAASDLVIDNAGVSRTHAVLEFIDQQYRVRDEESQNGITVNEARVTEEVLHYGDVIGIGKFEIELIETPDYPVQQGEPPKPAGVRNVMGTLQMDAGAAARLRDEALARIAAGKAQAAGGAPQNSVPAAGSLRPARTSGAAPSRRPAPRAPAVRTPVPAASASDLVAILKMTGLVLLGVIALGAVVLFLLSH